MSALLGAFLVELGLVTFRDVTQGGIKVRQAQASTAPLNAPLPSLYTSVIIVYGALAVLPKALDPIPALMGWGFVVATLLKVFTPGSANAANAANAAAVKGLTSVAPPKPAAPAAPAATPFVTQSPPPPEAPSQGKNPSGPGYSGAAGGAIHP